MRGINLDDSEVGLDDPAIDLPVYWLGRRFRARDLPPLELYEGLAIGGDGHGFDVQVQYDRVSIDLWEPTSFRRFLRTRLGRMVWTAPSTRRTKLKLPNGRAVVYAGFGARVRPPCPARPDHVLAHVFLPGVVATVNLPYGYFDVDHGTRDGVYNSIRGVTAVVRRLRPRPRRR